MNFFCCTVLTIARASPRPNASASTTRVSGNTPCCVSLMRRARRFRISGGSGVRGRDPHAPAVDPQPVLAEQSDRLRIGDFFLFENALGEGFGRVVLEHRANTLKDD